MDVVGLFFVGFLVGEAYDFVSFVGSSFSSPARPPRYGASPGCMNA